MSKPVKPNCCWYLKYHLTDDLSLRFFYAHDSKPELVKKWVLKSHINKTHSIIDPSQVDGLISISKGFDEIVGRNDAEGNYLKVNLAVVKNIILDAVIKEEKL